jgi:hypothetical protein
MITVAGILVAGAIAAGSVGENAGSDSSGPVAIRTCAPIASYRALNVKKYERACVISLRYDVDGVVECALRDAALMKIAQPDAEAPKIKEEIDRLAAGGRTPVIRYKAWLARLVFEYPQLFTNMADGDYDTAEEAFAAIAERLAQTLLAAQE